MTKTNESDVRAAALISDDGLYRYSLTRYWDAGSSPIRLIMLNPSTATATTDDATIRKCMAFARRLGHDGIIVHNLFAFRATNPSQLREHPVQTIVGPDNAKHLFNPVFPVAGLVTLCAWGTHGELHGRGPLVLKLLRSAGVTPMCLGRTKDGHPRHPLYLPGDTALEEL